MLCRMTALRQGRLRNARSEHRCENLCRLFNKHPKSRGQKTRSQKFVKEFFFCAFLEPMFDIMHVFRVRC